MFLCCQSIVDAYFTAGLFLAVTSQAIISIPGNTKSKGQCHGHFVMSSDKEILILWAIVNCKPDLQLALINTEKVP